MSYLDHIVLPGSHCLTWITLSYLDHIVSLGSHCLTWITLSHLDHIVSPGSHCLTWITLSHLDHIVSPGSHCLTWITLSHLDHIVSPGSHCLTWITLSHLGHTFRIIFTWISHTNKRMTMPPTHLRIWKSANEGSVSIAMEIFWRASRVRPIKFSCTACVLRVCALDCSSPISFIASVCSGLMDRASLTS